MKWLDALLGRQSTEREERAKDQKALGDLRTSFKTVGARTDRLIDAYERAEALRRKGHDAAP